MPRKLVFMGTPEIAVPALRALVEAGENVALVVTRQDQPARRGHKPVPPPVKKEALRLGLDLYQPPSVNSPECVDRLRTLAPDLGVTMAYGEILSPEVLAVPPLGFVNVHPSLLPRYRGSAPIHWALLRGDALTGVSIIQMDPRMDSGPILSQVRMRVETADNAGMLHDRLATAGAELLVRVLAQIDRGELDPVKQDRSEVTLAPKLSKEDGWIDWTATSEQIARFVRAMTPWPGARTMFQHGEEEPTQITALAVRPLATRQPWLYEPGQVSYLDNNQLAVLAGERKSVALLRIKPAGKKSMPIDAFLAGHEVDLRDRFFSPPGTDFQKLLARSIPKSRRK